MEWASLASQKQALTHSWNTSSKSEKWTDQHDMSVGQRKNLSPWQESKPWPPKHHAGTAGGYENLYTSFQNSCKLVFFCLLTNMPLLSRLRQNILLNFEFKNEATRANLQENKRILKWRPFWSIRYMKSKVIQGISRPQNQQFFHISGFDIPR